MRTARAIAGVAALTTLTLAACSASGSPPGRSSRPPASSSGPATAPVVAGGSALTWHSCPRISPRLQCAPLQVPLNYRDPRGRRITLALSRVPATAPAGQRLGALLVNPGGPGASGLSLPAFVAAGLRPSLAARYDIVGFDTRGTGASVPALHCDPGFFDRVQPGWTPASRAAERVLVRQARSYAADCERRFGWLLPDMTTADSARDLDSIRAALGQPEISYLGYSWGTYLGQVYATLFPRRVRRMVLDSTVDPEGAWYADNLAQDAPFQERIQAFFTWTAAHSATYQLGVTGPDPGAAGPASAARAVRPAGRTGRVRRDLPARRLQRPVLARPRRGAVRLRPPAAQGQRAAAAAL